jgi:hypothetical protein
VYHKYRELVREYPETLKRERTKEKIHHYSGAA